MASYYKTKSGDTWDIIAKGVYGAESYTSFLMSNNQKHLHYFIFPEGVTLTIEDLPTAGSTLPAWRT